MDYYYHYCKNQQEEYNFLKFLEDLNDNYCWLTDIKPTDISPIEELNYKDGVVIFIHKETHILSQANGTYRLEPARLKKYQPFPYTPNLYDI